MPNFDKTGPTGQGSMTGQGLGGCAGNKAGGRGKGMGRRMGCGRVNRCSSLSIEEQEKLLENKLEAIRKLKKAS
ncbi:MAG: DUF5320 domain-containing protein [Candidatus Gracilibacteria bacterium]|jgi:hypothetical protein